MSSSQRGGRGSTGGRGGYGSGDRGRGAARGGGSGGGDRGRGSYDRGDRGRGSYDRGDRGRGRPRDDGPDRVAAIAVEHKEIQINNNILPEGQQRKPLFPRRPDVGQQYEKKIWLIANHFRLLIDDITVYHYDIKFEPQDRRPMNQAVTAGAGAGSGGSRPKLRKLRQSDNRLAFDQFKCDRSVFTKSVDSGRELMRPVFDGNSNVLTGYPLKDKRYEREIQCYFDGQPFPTGAAAAAAGGTGGTGAGDDTSAGQTNVKVILTYAASIDLSLIDMYYSGRSPDLPRDALQALDIILRYGPTSNRIPIGNSLYPKWDSRSTGGGGGGDGSRKSIDQYGTKQVVFGHYQSCWPTKTGLSLVVDRSATSFYTGGDSLLDFIKRLMRNRDLRHQPLMAEDIHRLTKQLKGLRIQTNHLPYPRRYTIDGLSMRTAREQKFQLRDPETEKDREVSVEQYYQQQYGRRLDRPDLPLLMPKSAANKPIYLPIELCQLVPDQPVPRNKLDPQNTAQLVKECGSQTPVQRFEEIDRSVRKIAADSRDYLQEFKISIDTRPVKFEARVLAPPRIDGLDRQNRQKMLKPVKLDHWVIINLSPLVVNRQHIDDFFRQLGQEAAKLGMTMRPTQLVRSYNTGQPLPTVSQMFTDALAMCSSGAASANRLQMIVWILPDRSPVYNLIKLEADCKRGVTTQCIKDSNVAENKRVHSNLLLKINIKLDGINRVLSDRNQGQDKPVVLRTVGTNRSPIMIIGADVSHPAPADQLEASVAACIGSVDHTYCRFATAVRAQPKTLRAQAVEMIDAFDQMIADLLAKYRLMNRSPPEHIIYYRDGISESQFQTVRDYESQKLMDACRKSGMPKRPKLTFITVQKRHHTRMRPMNPEADGTGRMRNVPPGTTVDTHIVHPTDFDFYQCSHEGIQGTSRPTHYYVLSDDSGFTADELQKLTYYLCHIYARCDKPISIPAPVRYADRAAFRARNHIIAHNPTPDRPPPGLSDDEKLERWRQLSVKYNRQIKVLKSDSMYFV